MRLSYCLRHALLACYGRARRSTTSDATVLLAKSDAVWVSRAYSHISQQQILLYLFISWQKGSATWYYHQWPGSNAAQQEEK
jgi:hypothetical protein